MGSIKETDAIMRILAEVLDDALNPGKSPKEVGFVLLVMPFNGPLGARTNYISNGRREEVLAALKEVVARFEGQPEISGRA